MAPDASEPEAVAIVPEPLPVWDQIPEWMWVSVAVPILLGVIGHWAGWIRLGPEKVKADAAHDETVMSGYSQLVTHLREQVSTMQEQQGTDRQATDTRISRLEEKLDRAERRSERHHRVATRAVDLAEKQHAHIQAREDARRHHDPHEQLTWVPLPPPELLDREVIHRIRAELDTLDDDPPPPHNID